MPKTNPNFSTIYCSRNSVPAQEFGNHLTARCLHFPYRWVGRWFLEFMPGYFDPDLELVLQCGRMTSTKSLEGELRTFAADYRNRSFARRYLRLRVSTHRVRNIFRETIRDSAHARFERRSVST